MNLINFSQALLLLKAGSKIARDSWSDKTKYLILEMGYLRKESEKDKFTLPSLMTPDILAEDWYIVI